MPESNKVSFTPTEEQEAIRQAVRASSDNLMVTAYAGCSKSTTLELSAPGVRVPALALAFNKKIATELGQRLPGNFSAKTMNGLGHGAWARAINGRNIDLQATKMGKLVSKVAKDRKVDLLGDQWDMLRRWVSGVMQVGITSDNVGEPLLPDTQPNWAAVADELWIPREDQEFLYDLAREILFENNLLSFAGVISFDDQIYASVCLGGLFPKFPVVFVDEAQDLSPLNHAMLGKCLRQNGRLVVVGDPKQAIYAFRGADTASMGKIRALAMAWQDLPLATTFRCPKIVVARQQEHVPGFRAWHGNAEGRFAGLGWKESAPEWGWLDLFSAKPSPTASLAVLCRNNAPLLSLAFKLLRQQVSVVMLGRDIGKGLIALTRKIAKDETTSIDVFLGLLTEWQERETSLAVANGAEGKVSGIADRAECLRAVADGSAASDVRTLTRALEVLFARDSGQVTLGSIHRAKGLEWDCVLHLDPWRVPSRQAKKAALVGDTRQLEQEYNLRYVCETRSKHTLLNASLDGFE